MNTNNKLVYLSLLLLFLWSCGSEKPEKEQLILGNFTTGDTSFIEQNTLIPIVKGESSSASRWAKIENTYDGNLLSNFHVSQRRDQDSLFPITLTYYFDSPQNVDYFIYYPNVDWTEGRAVDSDILISTDGSTFEKVMEHNFNGMPSAAQVNFEQTAKDIKAIQLVIKSTNDDNPSRLLVNEVEFYEKKAIPFNSKSLFTDATCSELKSGVTLDNINACKNLFYKTLALGLYEKNYPTSFRIAEYQAYPIPDFQAKTHKTNTYSLLDNATGIYVDKGEDLIALVGNTNGQPISIAVINYNTPEDDGFYNLQTFPLQEGENKITMPQEGLIYVMYHTPTIADAKRAAPIKIHFASGKVNGYFDSQKHQPEDWNILLANANYPYFDVLGKYAHLAFPLERFKKNTPDGMALIDAYDKIVGGQMEFMGLFKYDKVFQNRMLLNVMYHSYMYATNYHTGYHDNTLDKLCNVDELMSTDCWGPAHEIGHCNQTRPGLLWVGTTEVTNNIMSEYIQTSVCNQPSRIQDEFMGENYINRYSKAWSSIIAENAPHAIFSSLGEPNGSDVFCKLIPFWQLELYFGKALGMTPQAQADKGGFYPTVYEMVRTSPNLKSAGEQQTEFVYLASKASGYNLIEFFEKWGFLQPIDQVIEDYWTERLTVTPERIAEVKQRIEALNLPKPEVALEYISDNTWELYRTKPAIIPGTASVVDNVVKMEEWKNVVVYEVYNKENKLVFICSGENAPSDIHTFKVPFEWNSGYTVKAVAADGTRVSVEV